MLFNAQCLVLLVAQQLYTCLLEANLHLESADEIE